MIQNRVIPALIFLLTLLFVTSTASAASFTVETQADWNNGTFNGTSADRADNSGVLGIGYLNGTFRNYWRMDDGSGTTVTDYSGNEDASKNGGSWADGVWGTGAFENENIDDVGLETSFNDAPSCFTWQGWMYLYGFDNGGHSTGEPLVDNAGSDNDNLGAGFNGTGNAHVYYDDGNNNNFKSSQRFKTDTWYLYTVVVNQGNYVTVYINDTKVVNETVGTLNGGATNNWDIFGDNNDDKSRGVLNGKGSDSRFVKTCRSPDKIKEDFRWRMPHDGDYNSTVFNLLTDETPAELETDVANITSATDAWATVTTSQGETQTVELDTNGTETHTLNFSETGGDAWVTFNMTADTKIRTPEVDAFTLSTNKSPTTNILKVETQGDWNDGTFLNLTSADMADNSGRLQLGWRNNSDGNNCDLMARLDLEGSSVQNWCGSENGTLQNTPDQGKTGVFDTKAYTLDDVDSDYIDWGDNNWLEGSDSVTVSAWFNVTGGSVAPIATKEGSNNDNFRMSVPQRSTGSRSLDCRFHAGDTTSGGDDVTAIAKNVTAMNKWHHAACVFRDDGTIEAWIDGEKVATATANSKSIAPSGNLFKIGRRPDNDWQFAGAIDEVRVVTGSGSNGAWSAKQIREAFLYGNRTYGAGEYNSSENSIPAAGAPTQLFVDSSNVTASDHVWAEVKTTNGESDTVKIDSGKVAKNYTLSFSNTGGNVWVRYNITADGSSPLTSPQVYGFTLYTNSTGAQTSTDDSDTWVNETGDTMTGDLNMSSNNIWDIGTMLIKNKLDMTGNVLFDNDSSATFEGNAENFSLTTTQVASLDDWDAFSIQDSNGNEYMNFIEAGSNTQYITIERDVDRLQMKERDLLNVGLLTVDSSQYDSDVEFEATGGANSGTVTVKNGVQTGRPELLDFVVTDNDAHINMKSNNITNADAVKPNALDLNNKPLPACTIAEEGQIRYNGTTHYGCNATHWNELY